MPAAQRDREALFDAIYEEHQRALYAYFFGRTADREQALDLLQELFLRVWRSLLSLESLAPEKRQFWLFAVARNLVVDHYRSRAARDRTEAAAESTSRARSSRCLKQPSTHVRSNSSWIERSAACPRSCACRS